MLDLRIVVNHSSGCRSSNSTNYAAGWGDGGTVKQLIEKQSRRRGGESKSMDSETVMRCIVNQNHAFEDIFAVLGKRW